MKVEPVAFGARKLLSQASEDRADQRIAGAASDFIETELIERIAPYCAFRGAGCVQVGREESMIVHTATISRRIGS